MSYMFKSQADLDRELSEYNKRHPCIMDEADGWMQRHPRALTALPVAAIVFGLLQTRWLCAQLTQPLPTLLTTTVWIYTVLDLLLFWNLCIRDPGFIPLGGIRTSRRRRKVSTIPMDSIAEEEEEDDEEEETGDMLEGSHLIPRPKSSSSPTKGMAETTAAARVDKADWTTCSRCHVHRPPFAHHCSICKRCVLRRDHHCRWLGQCVGAKNLKNFYLFLLHTSLLCITHALLSVLAALKVYWFDGEKESGGIWFPVLLCYHLCFLIAIFTFTSGLFALQTSLLCEGTTFLHSVPRGMHANRNHSDTNIEEIQNGNLDINDGSIKTGADSGARIRDHDHDHGDDIVDIDLNNNNNGLHGEEWRHRDSEDDATDGNAENNNDGGGGEGWGGGVNVREKNESKQHKEHKPWRPVPIPLIIREREGRSANLPSSRKRWTRCAEMCATSASGDVRNGHGGGGGGGGGGFSNWKRGLRLTHLTGSSSSPPSSFSTLILALAFLCPDPLPQECSAIATVLTDRRSALDRSSQLSRSGRRRAIDRPIQGQDRSSRR